MILGYYTFVSEAMMNPSEGKQTISIVDVNPRSTPTRKAISALLVILLAFTTYAVSYINYDRGSGHWIKQPLYAPTGLKKVSKPPCDHPVGGGLEKLFLAINFNHPHYENVDVLLDYYTDIFPKYAICGPTEDPSKKHEIIVIKQPRNQWGYYGYQCLPEAIKKNPGYDGYLYINDDMLINWWSFLHLNKSKVWFGCEFKTESGIEIGAQPYNLWWKRADSAVQCTKAFVEVENTPLYKEHRDIFYSNTNNRRYCLNCWSDIYYIPARLSTTFVQFSDIFFKHSVFLEAAVTTILALLDHAKDFVILEGMYLPAKYGGAINYLDGSLTSAAWREYNRKLVFIHPYKLLGHDNLQNVNMKNYRGIMVNRSRQALAAKCLDTLLYKSTDQFGYLPDKTR